MSDYLFELTDLIQHQENIFIRAGLKTLFLLLFLAILSLTVTMLSKLIVHILSRLLGIQPAFWIRNYLTFPGTIHHELSHALLALLTGARVTKISFFPKGNTLGHVDITTRGLPVLQSLQLSLSAVAPVLCGAATESLLWHYAVPLCSELWQIILLAYLMISILFHMTMSDQDLRNFRKGFLSTVAAIYLVLLITG